MNLRISINGETWQGDADPGMRLLDFLREQRGLTAAKEGCGEGECGACAVLLDDMLVNSCLVPLGQVDGRRLTTLEGISPADPLLAAFAECGGTQCGICTPGMILAARSLLDRQARPTLADVREGLSGNLCRCTGYTRIYAAVMRVAETGA